MNQETIAFIQELRIRLNRRQLEKCDVLIDPETDKDLPRAFGYLAAMKEVNSFLESCQWPDQYEKVIASQSKTK